MKPTRTTSIATGTLFVLATIAALAAAALDPTLTGRGYLVAVANHPDRQAAAALFYLVAAGACAGIAIALYPVLKKVNSTLALGSVVFRGIEAVFYTAAVVSLVSIRPLGQQLATTPANGRAPVQAIADALLSLRDHSTLAGGFAFTVGALLYYSLFYRSRLIPRWISGWGVAGVLLMMTACLLALFSDRPVTGYTLLILPIAVQEIVLAVWLLVKGFDPPPRSSSSSTSPNDEDMLPSSANPTAAPRRSGQAVRHQTDPSHPSTEATPSSKENAMTSSRPPRWQAQHRTRSSAVVAVALIAAALPLGGTPASAHASSPIPATAVAGLPPGGIPGVPVPTIRWVDAGDGYQQATAAVPYDYAHPRGKSFRLNMVRLPASDPSRKIGSLFVNFGGPGGAAAATVRAAGRFLMPPQVLARYDLVGVDPRGTGASQPVRCFATTREQQSLPYASGAKFPVTRAEETEAVAENRRFARACRARNGDLLDHVGTLPFARDLDVLRAAFGDRRINLYGLSYGTFLGQVIANLFPSRTGAIVLDAVVDPAWATGPAGTISWTRENADLGSWETLQRFFQLCAQAGPRRCAFAAGGGVPHKYAQLAARLREAPMTIPVPGKPPYRVGYSDLVGVTVSTLYIGPQWPTLARLLQAAYTGDAQGVAKAVTELTPPSVPGYDNYRDAQKAVLCGDTDNPRDPHRYRQVGQHRDATVAPYAGSLFAYLAATCAPWHGHPTERYTGPWTVRTRTPILILGNRYDPATPYRNAVRVSRLLPNSRLLTVKAVGHGSLLASICATEVTARYLLTGATPRPGTVCRQDAGPFDAVPPHESSTIASSAIQQQSP